MASSMTARTDKQKATRLDLPEKTLRLLREGGPDPAGVLMSVVLSMRQRGWGEGRIERALLRPHHRAGFLIRRARKQHGKAAARAEVVRLVAKADAYIVARPAVTDRHDAVASLARIRAAADDSPWSGRTGTTDRAVLEALVRLAERGGGPLFRASERQVAELANVNRRTAAASLIRLVDRGWLTRQVPGTGERGTSWRLSEPTNATAPVPPPGKGVTTGALPFATIVEHDACSTGCLGASGARVLALVLNSEDALTAVEMADVLGLSAQAVRHRLRQIASAGLALVADDRTWTPRVRDETAVLRALDLLASWRGKTGTQEARRERHELDRQAYADSRAAKQRSGLRAIDGGRVDRVGRRRSAPAGEAAAR